MSRDFAYQVEHQKQAQASENTQGDTHRGKEKMCIMRGKSYTTQGRLLTPRGAYMLIGNMSTSTRG